MTRNDCFEKKRNQSFLKPPKDPDTAVYDVPKRYHLNRILYLGLQALKFNKYNSPFLHICKAAHFYLGTRAGALDVAIISDAGRAQGYSKGDERRNFIEKLCTSPSPTRSGHESRQEMTPTKTEEMVPC